MINSINTYPVQYPTTPDAHTNVQDSTRKKRSLDEQELNASASNNTSNTGSRNRGSGTLDSLGQGRLL